MQELKLKLKVEAKAKVKVKATSNDEKVVVICPSCEVKLNVPSTYSGKVRCPDCELSFPVEGKVSEPEPVTEKVSEEEKSDELPTSSSSDDTLACPKCAKTIKVPYERRPAKARCPHCKVVFTAIAD